MNDEDRSTLEAWVDTLRTALNLDDVDIDIDEVLDLAGATARSVLRPAAPVTTFLVGLAAGRAGDGVDAAHAIRDVIATAQTLLATG